MNIIVCVKQVPDTEAVLSVREGKTINEENIKWIISPYDEYAVEEALKLKDKIPNSQVTVISFGPQRVESSLRTGLAMGAQNAVHIETENKLYDHKTVAKALAAAIKQIPDHGIIFIGKQAIDDDAYVTHAYLAEQLGIPVATNVIVFKYENNLVTVERETDQAAREKIEMKVPCLVAATKGLNEPRYASLMGIMKAKKIPIKKLTLAELNLQGVAPAMSLEKLYSPPEKPQGRVLQGEIRDQVAELVRSLKEEAKVL